MEHSWFGLTLAPLIESKAIVNKWSEAEKRSNSAVLI